MRWDHTLERREGSWWSESNLETRITLPNIITRDLFVDKGNSAQSTYLLSYVCTITLRDVAWCGKGQETQPLLTCHGILSSPRQGDIHPVLLPRNRLVKARPME